MSNTNELLLDVAKKEFFINGFEAVSGRSLCEICGISRSRLGYYFDTKENLGAIILDSFIKNFNKEFDDKVLPLIKDQDNFEMKDCILKIGMILDLMLDNKPYSWFLCEVMGTKEGHLVLYNYYDKVFELLNKKEKVWENRVTAKSYSRIFVNAFAANTAKFLIYTQRTKSMGDYFLIYSVLLLKLFDYPRRKRDQLLLEIADIYKNSSISMTSFDSINITIKE